MSQVVGGSDAETWAGLADCAVLPLVAASTTELVPYRGHPRPIGLGSGVGRVRLHGLHDSGDAPSLATGGGAETITAYMLPPWAEPTPSQWRVDVLHGGSRSLLSL